jgi:hypothetical protein
MSSRIRAHILSNVVGYVAVFIALSGTAYAVDKIGSEDIKKGAVKSKHVKKGAVKSKHVKNGTLLAVDFAPGQLPGQNTSAPAGAVSFFNLPACPSGWTELTAARGRYIVGLPVGGTLAGTAGTALTDLESRAVGQHTHGVTDPAHSHFFGIDQGATDASSQVGEFQDTAEPTIFSDVDQTSLASTGITINNAGTVAGTNSPYIQLLVCQKG